MKKRNSSPASLQKSLGVAIRRGRVGIGLSQEAFAGVVGLHRTYIGSVERGERNVSFQNLVLIAWVLRHSASQLVAAAEQVDNGVAK